MPPIRSTASYFNLVLIATGTVYLVITIHNHTAAPDKVFCTSLFLDKGLLLAHLMYSLKLYD